MRELVTKKRVVGILVIGLLSMWLFAQEVSGKKTSESSEPQRSLKQTPSVPERRERLMVVASQPKIEAHSEVRLEDYVKVWSSQYGNVTSRAELIQGIDTSQLGEQEVNFVVRDVEGNLYEESMSVLIVDTTPPQLIADDQTITVGENIDWLGSVSAKDGVDGDITRQIEVHSDFDSNKAGSYFVYYRVSDKSQNVSESRREVRVLDKVGQEIALAGKSLEEDPGISEIEDQAVINEESHLGEMEAQRIQFLGIEIPYQNGGVAQGQVIIDSSYQASTWGGNGQQSGADQANTHFIGHNPGVFSSLLTLYVGAEINISDINGQASYYQVTKIFQVNDYGVGLDDGISYWDTITGSGGGDRVTFQTCISESINLIVQAAPR